jgi:hypothetical protein
MLFFSAEAAIIYSAIAVAQRDPVRRCSNGHPVSLSARVCSICGLHLTEQEAAGNSRESAVDSSPDHVDEGWRAS